MFEESYKIRVSARAVLFHNNKLLLNSFGDGLYYNFPGGGIEKGENAFQAAEREVMEETGLLVKAEKVLFSLEYEPKTGNYLYGDGHHISFFFKCALTGSSELKKPLLPDVDPNNANLVSSPEWVPVSRLLELNILPHVNKNLLAYFNTGVFEPIFFEDGE